MLKNIVVFFILLSTQVAAEEKFSVIKLQKNLTFLRLYEGPIDGFWGSETKSAMCQFLSNTGRPCGTTISDLGLKKLNEVAPQKVIIYQQGTINPRQQENCHWSYNAVPKSIKQILNFVDFHIYFLCSSAADSKKVQGNTSNDGVHYQFGRANGSYIQQRVVELSNFIDILHAANVRPENIFVAGHSAGGWSALNAADTSPKRFNGVIAFAPACCGPRHETNLYPIWRKIIRPEQQKMMTNSTTMIRLVFSYEDDEYNRPTDLKFLQSAFPETLQLVNQNCGKGHGTHLMDCNRVQTQITINKFLNVHQ